MFDLETLRKVHSRKVALGKAKPLTSKAEKRILSLAADHALIYRATAALFSDNAKDAQKLLATYLAEFEAGTLFEEKTMFSVEPESIHGQIDREPNMPIVYLFNKEHDLGSFRVDLKSNRLARIK